MSNPVEGGEQLERDDVAAPAQPEAPAGDTQNQDAKATATPKGTAVGGASEPSPKKADPPAKDSKNPAASKTEPQEKRRPEKDPKLDAKLAFMAGDKSGEEPAKKPEPKAGKPGEQPTKGGTKPAAIDGAHDEPAKGPQTEDALPADPKKAGEAFASMRRELKTAKAEREALAPDADLGREFQGILKSHQAAEDFNVIRDDELAGVIKIQAALNRAAHARANGQAVAPADVAQIEAAIASLEPVAKDLGLQRQTAPRQVQAFAGKLPDELQAIADAQWLPEERLRKLYALELAQSEAEKSAAAAPTKQPASEKTTTAPTAPLARRDAVRESSAPNADDVLYIGKSKRHLAGRGVSAEAMSEHYSKQLVPIIVTDLIAPSLPKGGDAVKFWIAASPQAKHDFIVEAQQLLESRAATASPPPAKTPKAQPPRQALFQRNFAKGPGRNRSSGSASDPKSALAFMAGEAGE